MSTLHHIDDDHIVDDDIVVIPAVIYAAKSTQDRNQSIPEQLDDCRQMARENGWEMIGEFVDESFTAYTGNRGPGLAAAIEAAKAAATPECWTMLVAQHTSRFARGDGAKPGAPKALVELYHEWARANVRGRLVENDRAMASSAAAAQQGEADHLESERKSTSVKKGMRRRARDRGKLSGGIRPYGYRWTGPKAEKRLEVVPAEAEIVRRIFNDTIAGGSQMALARTLARERVPTMQGGAWLQATVGQMLRNPLYKGLVRNNGQEYPGDHEPIVSVELWERAARMRSRAARTTGHGGGRWPEGPHLFTKGLLRCGRCGHAMIPRTSPNRRGGLYEVYICDGRRRYGPESCPQTPLERVVVDKAMLAEFQRVHLDLDETRERVAAKIATDATIAAEQLVQRERDAIAADEMYKRVLGHYQEGRIEPEDWSEQRLGLIADRDAAHAALEQARAQAQAFEQARPLADAEAEVYRQLQRCAP